MSAGQAVRHAEIFFDPQTHTQRGIAFETVITGLHRASHDAKAKLGISSGLIMCFLRHLSPEDAMVAFEQALPFSEWLLGVGLDSSEVGHPPSKFERVYAQAREIGLQPVAHAGEEGPPAYIWEALDLLGARRIDHGIRCMEDERLVARLVEEQVPLTVCPLSNVKLRVFSELGQHNLKRMLDRGLLVTVNSDDPAYFGGYIAENYAQSAAALELDTSDLVKLASNSFVASFLPEAEKRRHLAAIAAADQRSLKTIS